MLPSMQRSMSIALDANNAIVRIALADSNSNAKSNY